MSEEEKINVGTEFRGNYYIAKGKRLWTMTFPMNATLEENQEIIGALAKEILIAMEREKEELAKKANEPQDAVVEEIK